MKPRVILKIEFGDILRLERGGLHHHLRHRIQHEAAQFLHARFRPAKQVEAALESLGLRHMTRRGIAMLLGLALQKQRLELSIEPLAIGQPHFAEWRCKQGPHRDRAAYHRENPCWPGATKRQRAVTSTSSSS